MRYLRAIGFAFLAVVVLGVLPWLVCRTGERDLGIGTTAFRKLKFGMTRQHVEALIGCPPGIYCNASELVYVASLSHDGSGEDYGDYLRTTLRERTSECEEWRGEKLGIMARYDPSGGLV